MYIRHLLRLLEGIPVCNLYPEDSHCSVLLLRHILQNSPKPDQSLQLLLYFHLLYQIQLLLCNVLPHHTGMRSLLQKYLMCRSLLLLHLSLSSLSIHILCLLLLLEGIPMCNPYPEVLHFPDLLLRHILRKILSQD